MCGIVGCIDFTKSTTKDILKVMADTLTHRGPDDSGYKLIESEDFYLGFGHRRLSILDLSKHGHQPMYYDNLTLIYNGEVYNFKELREELVKFGYTFDSDSDSEVILKAFHKWGIESVKKLRGMFSFSIYDSVNQKIYIVRDRVGVKPLYYYIDNGIVLYASELKALYKHPKFIKEIDSKALSLYLQFGYIESPYSIFKNTFKLKPSSYLEYDLKATKFEIKSYWNVLDSFNKNRLNLTYEKAKNKLEEIMLESFSLRMLSDVPVGTFLSGGIDSSLVTSILQKNSNQPIDSFTIGFDYEKYNEAPYAKKIAKHLGTNHTEHYCSLQDTMDIIPIIPKNFDEPFGDSSAIPTTLVSKIAKEKVSVILSGDGGDEVFCGYRSYSLFQKRYNTINSIPFKKTLNDILQQVPDPLYMCQTLHDKYYSRYLKLKNSLEFHDISNMYKTANSVFTKYEIKKILNNSYFYQENKIYDNISNLEQMMLSDFEGYLADDILVKVDRSSMSESLECREPLLDHQIIEFAAQLPIEFKKDKKILKDILSKYIPRDLFEREKTGFGIPINSWLRKDLKYLIEEYLDDKKIEKDGFFSVDYIKDLKELFFKGKNDDRKIWTILMFQMWYKENMDDE